MDQQIPVQPQHKNTKEKIMDLINTSNHSHPPTYSKSQLPPHSLSPLSLLIPHINSLTCDKRISQSTTSTIYSHLNCIITHDHTHNMYSKHQSTPINNCSYITHKSSVTNYSVLTHYIDWLMTVNLNQTTIHTINNVQERVYTQYYICLIIHYTQHIYNPCNSHISFTNNYSVSTIVVNCEFIGNCLSQYFRCL